MPRYPRPRPAAHVQTHWNAATAEDCGDIDSRDLRRYCSALLAPGQRAPDCDDIRDGDTPPVPRHRLRRPQALRRHRQPRRCAVSAGPWYRVRRGSATGIDDRTCAALAGSSLSR
ncbi:hypothetical protein ACPA9J_20580 [Pseudomonas aeruginosa]